MPKIQRHRVRYSSGSMRTATTRPDHPDDDVDGLPGEVVARVACDVVVRDPGDRPEPVADERRDAAEQEPVETPDEGRDLDGLTAACACGGSGVGDVVVDHQSLWMGPV